MDAWMGVMFYRGIDPASKGYTELRYYAGWHKVIGETELKAATRD